MICLRLKIFPLPIFPPKKKLVKTTKPLTGWFFFSKGFPIWVHENCRGKVSSLSEKNVFLLRQFYSNFRSSCDLMRHYTTQLYGAFNQPLPKHYLIHGCSNTYSTKPSNQPIVFLPHLIHISPQNLT